MYINGIDEKDNQIINLLRENSKMTTTEIGKRVNLSRTAVKNRITELERKGIIKGYSIRICTDSLPQMMTFITTIETEPNSFDKVAEYLKNNPYVVTLCQVSGECSLEAICVAESIEEMRYFAKKLRNENIGLRRLSAVNVWEVMKGSVLPY